MSAFGQPPVTAVPPPAAPPEAVVPPVVVAPVAPAAPAPGPWAADIEAYFPDEASRAAADRYMREKVQPSRTQLEQQLADPEFVAARTLYTDLVADPRETLAAVAEQLYGAEFAQKFGELFVEPTAPAVVPADDSVPFDKLPPEVQEIVKRDQEERNAAEYHRVVDGLIEGHTDLTADDKPHMHNFIANCAGDLAKAATQYVAWRTAAEARFKPAVVPDPLIPVAPVAPPTTLGAAGAPAGGAPPIAAKKQTLSEAMDEFLAEQRAAAPTTVGTV